MSEQMITIGKITGTQGNKGLVRVYPLTDYPERFFSMSQVTLLLAGRYLTYHIAEARAYKKFILLKFAEVPDMTAAEKLKGALLQLPRSQLVPLPADTFYIFDIIGLEVYDTAGCHLGQVSDVIQTGANDVYVVERPAAGEPVGGGGEAAMAGQTRRTAGKARPPLLIPALKSVVKQIDLEARRMRVELPPGLEGDPSAD
ncbi:MAG: ribosome maturation factor RimM [Desulfurispora sp.]|uniref:ribosome maturation factor RimM n=1 Tax=Desulfurispora sp. TaxID=3014275 RepID=UPI004049F085